MCVFDSSSSLSNSPRARRPDQLSQCKARARVRMLSLSAFHIPLILLIRPPLRINPEKLSSLHNKQQSLLSGYRRRGEVRQDFEVLRGKTTSHLLNIHFSAACAAMLFTKVAGYLWRHLRKVLNSTGGSTNLPPCGVWEAKWGIDDTRALIAGSVAEGAMSHNKLCQARTQECLDGGGWGGGSIGCSIHRRDEMK